MNKEAISTSNAPAALGPYSQGIKWGKMLFLSGQVGINPETKTLAEGGVEGQAYQVFKNIKAILSEAGADLNNVVKTTIFLKDMADFKKVNEIYGSHFQQPYPARSTFAVKDLPAAADIEIEVIAVI